ncbi:adenine phosphoribosyltransferase [Herbiconiux sp. VKM Ac-2851]|uniref:adenine phosphoribosyltransferase n=1 Tax=Herbiconiux sp. VKM Ac-2851 TaxID=2739025 RepID=UPI001567689F|nr:adenine phosphoribosyltransferase [Herbiconiux sp. VKM Ac-2851]NQX36524.1 adenine phosphoribosyltransferase [Herbiconiux sp. VKM Ac-2851]
MPDQNASAAPVSPAAVSPAVVEAIRSGMTETPDFPSEGILFRDLSGLFADADGLRTVAAALVEGFGPLDAVAGVEARGFVLGAAAAVATGHGMLAVRKAGKLPGEVLNESYALEYGSASLEVHPSTLPVGARVVIVDDVLATGGTLAATIRLMERAGWNVVGVAVVLELEALGGRAALAAATAAPVKALLAL